MIVASTKFKQSIAKHVLTTCKKYPLQQHSIPTAFASTLGHVHLRYITNKEGKNEENRSDNNNYNSNNFFFFVPFSLLAFQSLHGSGVFCEDADKVTLIYLVFF